MAKSSSSHSTSASQPVQGSISLPDINASVSTAGATPWRRLFAFLGPAYLVSVGYMDPGNWATDLEGGARFGYRLLWVLVISNLMALLLQTLSARLGVVARRDLAQACREAYPRPVVLVLWGLCELAIVACDLAELLGAAIALQLLFKLPLLYGVLLMSLDTMVILGLLRLGVKRFEAIIGISVALIGLCFFLELWLAKPDWSLAAAGLVPSLPAGSLFVAVGILGATVMPHNLYLHSSLVQTRKIGNSEQAKQAACRYNLIDSSLALNAALFVNAAILILAASVFHRNGILVTEIQQAHVMLAPLLGTSLASLLFGVALLFAGQSSTITGTLAGQIVMEGFLRIRLQPWLRRGLTRAAAVVPAVVTILLAGEAQVYQLLLVSQVVLSLQLPFAVLPLIRFTSDPKRMGSFVNPTWVKVAAWACSALILALNCGLVYESVTGWIEQHPAWAWLAWPAALLVGAGLLSLVLYLLLEPWLLARKSAAEVLAAPLKSEVKINLEAPVYRKILVPLDHSDKDEIALRHAVAWARQHQAQLLLLHVEEDATSSVFGEQAATAEVEAGQSYLSRIQSSLQEQLITAETAVRFSNSPASAIVKLAQETKPDMIVMAAHGHGAIGDLLYGQTIEKVRHGTACTLLVVR